MFRMLTFLDDPQILTLALHHLFQVIQILPQIVYLFRVEFYRIGSSLFATLTSVFLLSPTALNPPPPPFLCPFSHVPFPHKTPSRHPRALSPDPPVSPEHTDSPSTAPGSPCPSRT